MRVLILLPMFLSIPGLCALGDAPSGGPDRAYWRGDGESTPGPLTCREPAATDVWVRCDRWPDSSDLRRFAEDAIRLSGAETEHEKALAVWRWVRRLKVHTDGNPPIDYINGKGRNDDVMQVLNVFGAHYCGGLATVANHVWRAYGLRANSTHCASHAMVELYYADADGQTRPHLFDVNFGGYLYSHSRQWVAGSRDWSTDYSGDKANWVHSEHKPWSTHRMELALRRGERLSLLWGNEGKPYQEHMDPQRDTRRTPLFERGPYTDRTYGNGTWELPLDDAGKLAMPPVNMLIADGRFMPRQAGKPASAIWHVRTPYIISDMQLRMTIHRGTADDTIRVLLSVDGGRTFRPLWNSPPGSTGRREAVAELCPKYEVREGAAPPDDFVSPFGRYSCLLKLELHAAAEPGDCVVEAVRCATWVQQNFYALPQLHPGRNRITVRGKVAPGRAVRVTYVWDDARGKGRRNETLIEDPPFTYEILAAGDRWEDVICRVLSIEAVPAPGRGNATLVKEEPCAVGEPPLLPHVDRTRGRHGWWQRDEADRLPPVEKLIADLSDPGARGSAIKALQELRDPRAFDAVAKFALGEPNPLLKGTALVALFRTDRTRAKPILLRILEQPETVVWTAGPIAKGPGGADEHWAATAVIIGEMAVEADWPEAIPGLVKVWNSDHMSRHVPVALMRVLSRLTDERAAEAIRDGLTRGGYTAAYASLAAARAGLRDQIPQVRKVAGTYYRVWQQYAILALGRLGDIESAPMIRAHLGSWDESQRAAAAEALGALGDGASLAALQEALRNEPFPWVRQAMQAAIARIRQAEAERN